MQSVKHKSTLLELFYTILKEYKEHARLLNKGVIVCFHEATNVYDPHDAAKKALQGQVPELPPEEDWLFFEQHVRATLEQVKLKLLPAIIQYRHTLRNDAKTKTREGLDYLRSQYVDVQMALRNHRIEANNALMNTVIPHLPLSLGIFEHSNGKLWDMMSDYLARVLNKRWEDEWHTLPLAEELDAWEVYLTARDERKLRSKRNVTSTGEVSTVGFSD